MRRLSYLLVGLFGAAALLFCADDAAERMKKLEKLIDPDTAEVLKRIKQTGDIFFAESDRKWILSGATVHVSMVGFDDGRLAAGDHGDAPSMLPSLDLDGAPRGTSNVADLRVTRYPSNDEVATSRDLCRRGCATPASNARACRR